MSARRMFLTIGIGGATSSGKTTLAKHLVDLLQGAVQSFNRQHQLAQGGGHTNGDSEATASTSDRQDVLIVHQDDFAPREQDLPIKNGVRDWDDPYAAIDYERMDSVLTYLRQHGTLPASHSSHDHLNILPGVPLPHAFRQHWQKRFQDALSSASSTSANHLQIALVDGFLLYFSPLVRKHLDVRLLLRTSDRETLRARREARAGGGADASSASEEGGTAEAAGYATAEGTVWRDPPGYFDEIVWPGYVEAHRRLFAPADQPGGGVERGEVVVVDKDDDTLGAPVPGLVVLSGDGPSSADARASPKEGTEGTSAEMQSMVAQACEEVEKRLRALVTTGSATVE